MSSGVVTRRAMTLREAAEELGVTAGALRVQIHNGRLRGKRVGPIWTIERREVERYRRESLGRPGPKGRRKR